MEGGQPDLIGNLVGLVAIRKEGGPAHLPIDPRRTARTCPWNDAVVFCRVDTHPNLSVGLHGLHIGICENRFTGASVVLMTTVGRSRDVAAQYSSAVPTTTRIVPSPGQAFEARWGLRPAPPTRSDGGPARLPIDPRRTARTCPWNDAEVFCRVDTHPNLSVGLHSLPIGICEDRFHRSVCSVGEDGVAVDSLCQVVPHQTVGTCGEGIRSYRTAEVPIRNIRTRL